MSFAAQTKKELTLMEADACCEKAELSSLIRMNGSVQLSNQRIVLDISTENAAIARRIYSLLKKTYQVHIELLVGRSKFVGADYFTSGSCSDISDNVHIWSPCRELSLPGGDGR